MPSELEALALKSRGSYARAADAFLALLRDAKGDETAAARAEYHAALTGITAARAGRFGVRDALAEVANGPFAERHPGLRDRCLHLALEFAVKAEDGATARELTRRLGYLSAWRFVGPFDNERGSGFDRAFGPETDFDLDAVYDGKKRPVRWRNAPVDRPIGGRFDLDAMFRPNDQVLVYAATTLIAEADTDAVLWLGSDESIMVFLNGEEVHARDVSRRFRPDQDAVGLRLRAGANRLLLKIGDEEGPFEFAARLLAPDGASLRGVTASDDLARGADGEPREGPRPQIAYGAHHTFDAMHAADATTAADSLRHAMLLALDEPDDATARRDHALASRAVEAMPDSTAARYLLAFTRVRHGDAEERDENARRQDYVEILRRDPQHAEALRSLAELDLHDSRTPTRAIEKLRAALDVNPGFAAARVMLAEALAERERDGVLEAFELARAATEGPYRSPLAASARLRNLRQQQDVHGAVDWLETCIADGYPPTFVGDSVTVADTLATVGRREAAIERLEASIALSPFASAPRRRLAAMFEGAEQYARAIEVHSAWLKVCPEDDRALTDIARLHGKLGETQKQREFLRTVVELNPNRKVEQRQLEFLRADEVAFYEPFVIDAAAASRDASLVPDDAEAANDAVVHVLQHDVIRAYRNGTTSRYHHRVVRILNEQGVREYASFAVPHFWGEQRARLLQVRVVKDDGSELRPRLRGSFVRMPPLAPGDVCDIRYRVDDIAPSFFGDYFGHVHQFTAPDGSPTLRSALDLVLEPGRDYTIQTANGAPDAQTTTLEDGATVHRFEMRDLSRREPEELRPEVTETEPVVRVTTYRDWDQFASWWANLIRKQSELTDGIRAKVRELTAGLDSERAKIDAIYRFVTTEIQYKAWEFGVHGYQPYSTAVIFDRRHGDCKDKSILMNAMLAELGIEAHPVLIYADPRRSADDLTLAMVQHFNHCISYLPPADGRDGLFLDGTAVYHPIDTLPDMDQGAHVLVVRPRGGEIRTIEWTPAEENRDARTFTVRLEPDGSARVKMIHEPKHSFAVTVREQLGNQPAKRDEHIERELAAMFGSVEVLSVRTSDLLDLTAPVRIEVEFRCPEFATVQDGALVLEPGFGGGYLESITSKRERRFALVLGVPWSSMQRIDYRLPSGFEVSESPSPTGLDRRFGSFTSRWVTLPDGTLRAEREETMKTHRIEPQEYPEFRDYAAEVGRADRRVVIVRRKS